MGSRKDDNFGGSILDRKYEREEMTLLVSVLAGSKIAMRGMILSTNDISPDGVFISTDELLPINSKVFVKYILPSGRRGISPGIVVRKESGGFAVKFDRTCPLLMEELGYSKPLKKLTNSK